MPPKDTLWPIEPHTEAKHRVLRKYLDRWLPIMARQSTELALIDGFAGPGVYRGGQPGSPVIMLQALLEHRERAEIERRSRIHFVFVESDAQRHARLASEIAPYVSQLPSSWPKPVVANEDFAVAVQPRVAALGSLSVPVFMFVDPFGLLEPPPELTATVLGFRRCETLTFVPTNYVTRFVADERQERTWTYFFGGTGWRRARGLPQREASDILVEEFAARLRRDATHVRSFELETTESQLYHLFFASNHERGYQKMKEAMWAVDPVGGQRFSDTTTPGQSVLFSETADMRLLERQLRERFPSTEWHRYDVMERFTWFETAYLDSHLKADLRRLQAANEIQVMDGGKRGGWLPHTLVHFVR